MALDDTFGDVLVVAYDIEKSPYSLYMAISLKAYKDIISMVPIVITSTIPNALKPIIEKVTEVVKQFTDTAVIDQVKRVLAAGLDVVHATMDLLPVTVQEAANKVDRFLRTVVGLVTAGIEHIRAIIERGCSLVAARRCESGPLDVAPAMERFGTGLRCVLQSWLRLGSSRFRCRFASA